MKRFNKKLLECEHLFEADKANDFQQGYAVAGSSIKDYPFCDEKGRKAIRDFFTSSTDESTPFRRGVMSAARDAEADSNKNKYPAPNGDKGNKEKYMANQNVNNQERTPSDKAKYYAGRVDNVNLTAGQRRWASIRLNQLTNTSAGSGQPTKAQAQATTLPPITDRCCAESAVIGYGSAKAGRRVAVDKSVKDSFSNGVKLGRGN